MPRNALASIPKGTIADLDLDLDLAELRNNESIGLHRLDDDTCSAPDDSYIAENRPILDVVNIEL